MFETETASLKQILEEQKVLSPQQIQEVMEEHDRTGKSVAQVLVDFGLLTMDELYQMVARHLGAEYLSIENLAVPSEVVKAIPGGAARMYGAFPIRLDGRALHVALVDPLNPQAVDELTFLLDKDIHIVVAPVEQIQKRIQESYGEESESVAKLLKELSGELDKQEEEITIPGETLSAEELARQANETPIIRFVNVILQQAIMDRASDIHFEPFADEFKIRYRVDGALYEMAPPPKHLALPVTSRLKVMSNLNIAERRLPQDGRIQMTIGGRPVDLRVSTLPTQFGESVVLRVLDRTVVSLDIGKLGMPTQIFDSLTELIRRPNGIIIVTGPTGSGKTTTLYSCLRQLNTIDLKLLTAEDPVEYDLDCIKQEAIHEAINLTFAQCLRAFLRQDPDIIMVGEMRDLETAQIAIQASLTGHLVFTTLHTNDAAGAVTRLVDMGVEPFLISSTLEAILAQRLVRTICKNCRTPYEPTAEVLFQLGLSPQDVKGKNFYFGKGCSQCNEMGYRGRKGIFELLITNDVIRDMINQRVPAALIRQRGVEQGMVTLREDGLRCIFDGETTVEEVLKYT
jgi:type IV pilus assembly protein PilB